VVEVDGQHVSTLWNGSTRQIELDPGAHSVRARMLGAASETRRFTLSEDRTRNNDILIGFASGAIIKGIYAPGRVLTIRFV
jgi:hypothetical protein